MTDWWDEEVTSAGSMERGEVTYYCCMNTEPLKPRLDWWAIARSSIAIAVLTLLIWGLLSGCQAAHRVRIGTAISVRCTEDMPCWDCDTMGNRICGPEKGAGK